MFKNEKRLLLAIKYLPLLLIIILSILVTSVIELSNKKLIKENIIKTTDLYTKFHNEDIKEEVNKVYNYIKNTKENSEDRLKQTIKQRVYEAHSIASKIYEENKDSKSKEEILELIKTALGSIIYNKGRGYFFIDDVNGVGVLQPLNRDLEGKNKLEFKDAKGYQFVKTIVKTIKEKGERYDRYYWYKGGNKKESFPKISFYKYFEPFNVIIGTGDYIDDYEKELKAEILDYIKSIKLKKENYIFVLDYDGNVLVHDDEKRIGKNTLHEKDGNGVEFVRNLVNLAKTGDKEGFINYFFLRSKDEHHHKTSFVKGFDTWQWIIGTGYHDDDLNEIIQKETLKLQEKYQKDFKIIMIISAIATLVLLVASMLISKMLEKRFVKYQNRIKMEEMEFKNLFQSSDVGLSINDVDGKFIKVNNKFIKMLGYKSVDDFHNKNWKDLSYGSFYDEEQKFNALTSKEMDKYTMEKIYIKADGTMFDAFLTANSFTVAGEVKYILFTLIDITDVKTKDNLLFQQSKMAAMGEMIANIAHQWRQPLSAISTASSGAKMQKEFGVLDDENLNKALELITSTSQYLSQTIEDFRDFFNPRKEKIYINIKDVVEQSLKLISTQFKNMEIEVIKDLHDAEILTFKNEMIQILINLLNNSRDALRNKENEKFIIITTTKKNGFLTISIKDNAGGIDEKILNRIFEPYFTTKHKSQGTGIGLYMVDEIVRKHMKGSIHVTNTEYSLNDKTYSGAEFKIDIPIEE